MGRIKSIATQIAKGKRVRMDTNSLEPLSRNRFKNKEKQRRYEEINNWAFICLANHSNQVSPTGKP